MRSKGIYITAFLLGALIATKAQGQRTELLLIPYEENGLWGYKTYEGAIVVLPKFQEAYPTYDFRGRIKIKGKYGFVDENGSIAIKPMYIAADDFKHGRTKVNKCDKLYTINTEGKVERSIQGLCGGGFRRCLVPQGLKSIDTLPVNKGYKLVLDCVKKDGEGMVRFSDTSEHVIQSTQSIGRQQMMIQKKDKIALVLHTRYPNAAYFDSTLQFTYDEIVFVPCSDHNRYYDELIKVRQGSKWGLIEINYNLRTVIEPKYLSILETRNHLSFVEYEEGKYGYVNHMGYEYFK